MRRQRWILSLGLVMACEMPTTQFAAPDANPVGVDASEITCRGRGGFQICLPSPPPPSVAFLQEPEITITTDDNGPACAPVASSGKATYCVVAATTIKIAAGHVLHAHGKNPLVLMATDRIDIEGTIDVASYPGQTGAGAGPAACQPAQGSPELSGGAGGSFVGIGGHGGVAADNPEPGGIPGAAILPDRLSAVRGGCAGQPVDPLVGADGGGAVYLLAGSTIHVSSTGTINAGGAGGMPGAADPTFAPPSGHGGSGGGSGGMIMLDAPTVALDGGCSLWANGGGGGEAGGSKNNGVAGTSATGIAPAPGGHGPAALGGDGGSGSAIPLDGGAGIAGTSDQSGDGGGGGGGGGAGLIFIPCSMPQQSWPNVSPAPTRHCSDAM